MAMTIRQALNALGYNFDNQVQPPLFGKDLHPDTDIAESGLMISEKLCTPGCGCWAVVVEVQRADDWGMFNPWCCFYFKVSEAKLNPSEWSFETRWYSPGDLKKLNA